MYSISVSFTLPNLFVFFVVIIRKNTMNKDGGPGPTNPMLYDPIPEGTIQTTKIMQFLGASAVSFAAVSAGTALAWTSPFESQVNENSTISVTPDQKSWIGAYLAVGAFIGALPAGILAERIGRRWASIVIGIPYLISWAIIAMASSVTMIYIGRIFSGIATGASCVVAPMFISEIAETSLRGALGAFFQLFLTIGILFIYLFGAIVDWVTLTWIVMIFPILLIVSVFFIPDSPIYLVKQGSRHDATAALKKFWGKQCDTQQALANIQADLDAISGDAKLSDLFTVRPNLMGLIISLGLMFFQQFSGINAVIFYTQGIFETAGSTLDPKICAIIVGVVQVIMTVGSALLIEKAGRRILLLQSSVIMGLCLVAIGVYFTLKDVVELDVTDISFLPLASVVLFIVSFSLGFGPIPWMMMGELFANDVKGVASAIAVMFNWTLVFVITKTFGLMKESWGNDITFYFFATFMLIGTVFIFVIVPETKGKSNAQIQAILAGKR
ncbi:CLUMA_CG014389, isoform A [Clunio marinus]|uniref:Facilitated trehalose transporter Tret1 n=1 Tax=Clunio marinus TaxID=568069 RepID=A0A1J1IMH8_9DIPT|nr:CLUMA_CG014389, isoform A [Clunio marinus]